MNNSQRESIIDRIRKLSKMTTERGCSESEALTALEMANRLIAEYDIEQDELTIREDARGCIKDEFIEIKSVIGEWTRVMGAIQSLYNCKVWFQSREDDLLGIGLVMKLKVVNIYGFPTDVAAALAMTSICHTAIATESERWGKENRIRSAKRHADFQAGMAIRLAERIREMKPTANLATGTSLMVLKDQLVKDEFAQYCREQGLHLRPRTARRINDQAAFASGKAAGNRVDLGRGDRVSNSTKAIGGY
jgi:hypothetical protein